jgi:hypothetical protein
MRGIIDKRIETERSAIIFGKKCAEDFNDLNQTRLIHKINALTKNMEVLTKFLDKTDIGSLDVSMLSDLVKNLNDLSDNVQIITTNKRNQ